MSWVFPAVVVELIKKEYGARVVRQRLEVFEPDSFVLDVATLAR